MTKFKKELEKIEIEIAKSTLSEGYIKSLDLFSEKYIITLDDIYKNRKEVFEIIHSLIDRIIISTRPINKNDKVAGRKKEKQEIPNRIEIKFKLPKDIMAHLVNQGFGVKNANL